MTKVLYFERAGMDFYGEQQTKQSDVGNFRIRTSFYDNDGEQWYVELGNGYRQGTNGKSTEEFFLHVLYFFKVSEQLDNPNRKVCIKFDIHKLRELDYTKENIVKLINETINCNFDSMEVLNNYYGYHVHADNRLYNLMEHIDLNHERAMARKSAYDKIDKEYRTKLNEKYSVIGMKEMNDNDIVIRCHTYEKDLQNAGLERVVTVPVTY